MSGATQSHGQAKPQTSENKPVNGATQECPYKHKKQCEVEKLEVIAKYVYTNDATQTPVVTKLHAEKRLRHELIPPKTQERIGHSAVELLGKFDLVLECLAGFPNKGNEEGGGAKPGPGEMRKPGAVAKETKGVDNVAEIEVEAEVEGECGVAKHALIRMKPFNEAPATKYEFEPAPAGKEEKMRVEEAEWKPGIKKIAVKEVTAPTFKSDLAGGDNAIGALFRLIMWIWHANASMDIEFVVESCGVHTPTEAGTQSLNALVRVFRDINAAIGLKVPPVKKITHSSERTIGIGSDKYASQSVNGEHRTRINTESNKTGFKGVAVFDETPEDEFALYFKFNELEFQIKETYDKAKEEVEAKQKAYENAKEKYKHWKDERARKSAIDKAFKEAFGDLLTFRDKLEIFFRDFVAKVKMIKNALISVLDLMKKMPQMGFKITFEIGFLSGDIFLGWAHTGVDSSQPMPAALKERYAPLLHKLHFETKISLITFKVEASFGILIDGGALGRAEARVAGSLGVEVAWQTFIDVVIGSYAMNGKDADMLTQQLTGTTTCNLRATVEVKVAWLSWKKEIGIESGIAVDGRMEWKFMKGEVKYSVNVRSLETGWYIYSTNIKTGQANVSLHKIFEARQLFHAENNLRLT